MINNELEVKVLEINRPEIVEKIKKLGAGFEREWLLKTYIYDFPDKRLLQQKSYVRIRNESGNNWQCTLKQKADNEIEMEEIEMSAEEPETACRFLEMLGLERVLYFEKKRKRYCKDNIIFDLDQLPDLPSYLEIEAENEEQIKWALENLQIPEEQALTIGPRELLARYSIHLETIDELKFAEESSEVYVIIDPGQSYAADMMEFLGRYDKKTIIVYSEPWQKDVFHGAFLTQLQDCVAGEYILPEFKDLKTLAAAILDDRPQDRFENIIPWTEFSVELGAQLGELLGLDWNSPEITHRFRNKYALKDYLRNNSCVRINASQIVKNEHEARNFQEKLEKWPIVVKPTQGAGSRNVFFSYNMAELMSGCVEVFHNEGGGEILLEEFIGGHEYVVNGLTDAEANILITDIWFYDKRDSHGMKNLYYETIKVNSYDPVFSVLAEYAGQVIENLKLRKAPFHMELKLEDEGPCLVEVGARFAGGNQPLMASKLHARSLFELAACHYIADIPLRTDDVNYQLYDSQQARIINGIQTYDIESISIVHGIEEVAKLPSFFMYGFVKPAGCPIAATRDMYGKSYEVYLIHQDPEQIAQDAILTRELLRYE